MIDKNNPWHKVSFGEEAPEVVTSIIEIPQGTRAKYELDKDYGMVRLDRVIRSSMVYPANYGFIPQTYCDDQDPLDVLVLSQVDIIPFCLVDVKVIGVMHMIDGGEMDDKIIAVAKDDMHFAQYNDLNEVPEYMLKEIENFFEDYKKLEKKSVEVNGFSNAAKAKEIVSQAIEDYKVKFK